MFIGDADYYSGETSGNHTYDCALLAAGSVLAVVDEVLSGRVSCPIAPGIFSCSCTLDLPALKLAQVRIFAIIVTPNQ
ncbi:unnamed protein product [Protopolystoma xenopodis]|uniref:Uncharacterized protein n=1 Tax=Protopolystoma xenopodis TaxID=117903 RepID=A0A3S5BT74_9PLAT|nr:unnamed protein product [Protopolystoma xenopodis]